MKPVSLRVGEGGNQGMDKNIHPLLPFLRCPHCSADRQIEIKKGTYPVEIPFATADNYLVCSVCKTAYPITEDFIPILWDAEVRALFLNNDLPVTNLSANKTIYDSISEDYQHFTRQNQEIAQRLQNAARSVLDAIRKVSGTEVAKRTLTQLDFGCGPGHVLCWLKEFGFQQIGLDVSLQNLRNARKNTGSLVICGNACNMPIASGSVELVTESSVLHHIQDWKTALKETARICARPGAVILDSEPSRDQMAWSKLAVAVFNARFPVYKILSRVWQSKYVYRNLERAKLNLKAEIHHQPGTGFPLDELSALYREQGMQTNVILSPMPDLTSKAHPKLKNIILNALSLHNPWKARYGEFTAIILTEQGETT